MDDPEIQINVRGSELDDEHVDVECDQNALAALQSGEESELTPADYINSLPKPVRRRLRALKKLQAEMISIEAKFYEEVHDLECKYAAVYAPLYQRRHDIINGVVEPTDEECVWDEEEENNDDELSSDMQKVTIEEVAEQMQADSISKTNNESDSVPGVPDFWLTVFKNDSKISDLVQECDEPILRHLRDVRVSFLDSDPKGFIVEFHFDDNEFFTDSVLTKQYSMRFPADPEDILGYEGPEIIQCKGCTINWKPGRNVTVKLIKKVQKHKTQGTKRAVTKTVRKESFFNFFSPPEAIESQQLNEELQDQLTEDYELGHFFLERVVPRAVLFFTGEIFTDDADYEDEEAEDGTYGDCGDYNDSSDAD